MFDPHVHLRDGEDSYKETLRHGLKVAEQVGLNAVGDMAKVTNRKEADTRLRKAQRIQSPVFYGFYIMATGTNVDELIKCHREFSPHCFGSKFFTCKSSVNEGISLASIVENLDELSEKNYRGVVYIHSEIPELFKSEVWSPKYPATHSFARNSESEWRGIEKILGVAVKRQYPLKIHFTHVTCPKSVELVDNARSVVDASCGITPNHFMLNYELIPADSSAMDYKVNPPLRSLKTAEEMFKLLKSGKIDLIESDHAPHTRDDKLKKHMSGIVGLPIWPYVMDYLEIQGFNQKQTDDLTHYNACRIIGVDIPLDRKHMNYNMHTEYESDAHVNTRELVINLKNYSSSLVSSRS